MAYPSARLDGAGTTAPQAGRTDSAASLLSSLEAQTHTDGPGRQVSLVPGVGLRVGCTGLTVLPARGDMALSPRAWWRRRSQQSLPRPPTLAPGPPPASDPPSCDLTLTADCFPADVYILRQALIRIVLPGPAAWIHLHIPPAPPEGPLATEKGRTRGRPRPTGDFLLAPRQPGCSGQRQEGAPSPPCSGGSAGRKGRAGPCRGTELTDATEASAQAGLRGRDRHGPGAQRLAMLASRGSTLADQCPQERARPLRHQGSKLWSQGGPG